MIAVDTSALMAIVLDEEQAATCRAVLAAETEVVMSAGTLAETLIVAARRGVKDEVEQLIAELGVDVVPLTAAAARGAAAAYVRWGKGSDDPALNFGDCFAYEVAATNKCRLLFVGEDFSKTDLRSAI